MKQKIHIETVADACAGFAYKKMWRDGNKLYFGSENVWFERKPDGTLWHWVKNPFATVGGPANLAHQLVVMLYNNDPKFPWINDWPTFKRFMIAYFEAVKFYGYEEDLYIEGYGEVPDYGSPDIEELEALYG